MPRKNFQRPAIIILWLLMCATWCHAQDSKPRTTQGRQPDFSGNWELDRVKSVLSAKLLDLGPKVTLTITHSDPELRIIQKTKEKGEQDTREFHYCTDGSGETNPPKRAFLTQFNGAEMSGAEPRGVPSRSEWKGKKLKTRSAFVLYIPQGKQATVKVEEVWEMSKNGKTLIQTTSFSSDGGIHFKPPQTKKIFNRIQ